MSKSKKLVVILGPTAVGKTALAIDLAKHFQTEIISADSRQFFHELNIGVARPSEVELKEVPHHFIGFISIHDSYSAGTFERDALAKLEELFSNHDVVICCGGSMMYVDALLYGLDELPSDKNIRSSLKLQLEKEGIEGLQKELLKTDPEYYNQMDTQNPHRVIRALEVCLITSKRYSELRKSTINVRDFEIIKIGLHGERNWLYQRINHRVDQMIASGLLEEVKSLIPFKHCNALNTVGYKELFDYFEKETSLEEAVNFIKQHTRNFAKRQMTWWKRDESIHWMNASSGNTLSDSILWVDK